MGVAQPACLSAALAAFVGAASAGKLRLRGNKDSACSDLPDVAESQCLVKNSGQCMWLSLASKNLCMPCLLHDIPIPCVPPGASYGGDAVNQCSMACAHQQVLAKVSVCTDVSGDISRSDCEGKGTSEGAKCMWTAYRTRDGQRKSMCGPCLVEGITSVPPYIAGAQGPEEGSRVEDSYSQCDEATKGYGIPCIHCPSTTPNPNGEPLPVPLSAFGLTAASAVALAIEAPAYALAPTQAPAYAVVHIPMPISACTGSGCAQAAVQAPAGVAVQASQVPAMRDATTRYVSGPRPPPIGYSSAVSVQAPIYTVVPVQPPYNLKAFTLAAAAGARAAGWPPGIALPPTADVSVYGTAPPGAPPVPRGIHVVRDAPPPGLMGLPGVPPAASASIPPATAGGASFPPRH